MSQVDAFDEARLVLNMPVCKSCGAKMWLLNIAPEERGYDRRSFECTWCDTIVSEVVKYR
jgi:hypothetical protein